MNCETLINSWQSEMRNASTRLTDQAFANSRQFAQATHDMCRVDQVRLMYLGHRAADHFWAHNRAHRTLETQGYPGHFGCRGRLSGLKFELSWYYNEFKRLNDGTGRHRVLSHHVPKEGQFNYYSRAFSKAHDWELPVILDTEYAFQLIRRLNANLTVIRRKTQMNLRLLDSLERHIAEFEEPTHA